MNRVRFLLAFLLFAVPSFAQQPVRVLPQDPDDASIAVGQTNANNNSLQMAFDGSVWRRVTFGTAGTAATQVWTIQGIASMTPVQVSQATGTNLHMVCDSGCSSSTAPADNSAFSAGVTSSSPISGFYHAARDTLTDGRIGAWAFTSKRAGYVTLETPNGDTMVNETADSARVTLYDTTGTAFTQDTQLTHNAAMTPASTTGSAFMFRASAAAPTDVGADDRGVLGWALRNGAQVVNPSFGGTLSVANNGGAGAGTQRIVIANDNTGIANWGQGATGSAVPAGAQYIAGNSSGTLGAFPNCDNQAFLNMSTATTTELIASQSSKTIRICHIRAEAGGTTTMTFKRGTGTNCGTGTNTISEDQELTAQSGYAVGNGAGAVLFGGATTNALCVTNSQAVNLHIFVTWTAY